MLVIAIKVIYDDSLSQNFAKEASSSEFQKNKKSTHCFSGLRKQGIISYTWCIKKKVKYFIVTGQITKGNVVWFYLLDLTANLQ